MGRLHFPDQLLCPRPPLHEIDEPLYSCIMPIFQYQYFIIHNVNCFRKMH